jgi:hypothetical protein
MGKTMAWFFGPPSFIPSHMAAWTRVSFLGVALDGATFFWANACEKNEANKINTIRYVIFLRLIDMLLSLLLDSPC